MKLFLDTADIDEIRTAVRWGVIGGVTTSSYDDDSEVLAASIRHPRHVTEAALAGAHVATLPSCAQRRDGSCGSG